MWSFKIENSRKTAFWWGAGLLGAAIGGLIGLAFGAYAVIASLFLAGCLFRIFSKWCAPRLYETFHPEGATHDKEKTLENDAELANLVRSREQYRDVDFAADTGLEAVLALTGDKTFTPIFKKGQNVIRQSKSDIDKYTDHRLREAIAKDFTRGAVDETLNFFSSPFKNARTLFHGLRHKK